MAGTGGHGPYPILILQDAAASSTQGSRPSQLDRYSILRPDDFPDDIGERLALFVLCDGHASREVGGHAKYNLPRLLLQSKDLRQGDYDQAIQSAIKHEERLLFEEFVNGKQSHFYAGSTLAICLVNLTRGLLVVANVGDSHVMLGELYDPASGLGTVRYLTKAHKPGNPDERRRIEHAGGSVVEKHGALRVGRLNMSRALGDLAYKNLSTEHTSIGCPKSDSREIPDAPGVQDGLLSSEPFITRMTLAEHGAYILALTSDGVTDQLEDSEILNRLSDSWDADPRAQRAARILVSEVGHRPRSDNATCIAVFMKGRNF